MDWTKTYERLQQIQDLIERPYTEAPAHVRRVLLERARNLSTPDKQVATGSDDVLIVRAGGDRYGVPLAQTVEVIGDAPFARVPGSPSHVAGLIQVRGDVRPVYRLDVLLGTAGDSTGTGGAIILLRTGGREVAVLAGEIEGLRTVSLESRRPPPAGAAHALWATEDLITVVDLTSVLRKER